MSAYYHDIYQIVVTILTLYTSQVYSKSTSFISNTSTKSNNASTWLIAIAFILFIGFRNPYAPEFGDSQSYSYFYELRAGELYIWDWHAQNLLFDNLFRTFSSANLPIYTFYIFCATIYFGGICYAAHSFFKNNSLMGFIVYLAAFSTYTFSINGIKAGAAASLFVIALALRDSGKKYIPLAFLLLSIGFHHSMRVPVVAYFVCLLIKKPKLYTYFWIICFIISALHITYFQNFFANLGDDKAMGYLAAENAFIRTDIAGGFRIDFILYSFMPILVGWYAIYKRKINSTKYEFLLNLYTFVNSIWMLCIYASFTNRIAYLSWLMYPYVLIYPFMNEKWGPHQNKIFTRVVYLHLGFTLFMNYIYK